MSLLSIIPTTYGFDYIFEGKANDNTSINKANDNTSINKANDDNSINKPSDEKAYDDI